MRMLLKNKRRMHYALYDGEEPVYVLDEDGNKIVDYVDDEGNVYYRETGEYKPSYTAPVEFFGNISMSSGESSQQEYGVDVSAYDAVLVMEKDASPVTETSLIWFETEPVMVDDRPDGNTADYKVTAVKPGINHLKILLSKVLK